MDQQKEKGYDSDVLIVGAGPVGMLLAYQLDRLGIRCIIAERNVKTTQWPKMDLTNCRSMEILRILGLADDYRAQQGAVSADANFDSIFITSLQSDGRLLGSWRIPSVEDQRKYIKLNNDGSQPAEPGQRCSQIVFEAWLKQIILSKLLITSHFGWTYIGHAEGHDGVTATFVDSEGKSRSLRAKYLVGCDGGSSRVRKSARIKMVGGQIPAPFYLVHFRSAQLARELHFGRFWHAFPAGTGFVIDQDEKDTFTAHYPLRPDEAGGVWDPAEIVYKTLGGSNGKWRIKIDEVLVHSEWKPSFSIAEKYSTDDGRVFLAGDAAHRNPPHGGYGMNSGVIDAIDLGWRLAAVLRGYGGKLLLDAYGIERRPMMIRALQRSYRHVLEHVVMGKIYQDNWDALNCDSSKGDHARTLIEDYITISGPETLDRGIELDLRYDHSPVIYHDGTASKPWDFKRYQPSTRPGQRIPHVFLKDGITSMYDLLGTEWTLVEFAGEGSDLDTSTMVDMAHRLGFPLKHVILGREDHVRSIWERDLVLVRPDTHVAWRGNAIPDDPEEVERILLVVSGRLYLPRGAEAFKDEEEHFVRTVKEFTEKGENDQPTLGDKIALE